MLKAHWLYLTMTASAGLKRSGLKVSGGPGTGDFGFCEGLGAFFYLGRPNSFAPAKRGTFAPPLPLPLEGEEGPRGGVRRGRPGRVAPPALPASV